MRFNYWLYDSFANSSFQGHSCAIVEVDKLLDRDLSVKIAKELCQKVTCFFYKKDHDVIVESISFDKSLWPINHGLLAVAKHCFKENESGIIHTGIYPVNASVNNSLVSLVLKKAENTSTTTPDRLNQYFDVAPISIREMGKTCIIELRTAEDVISFQPDFNRISKMEHYDRIVITAEDESSLYDYVCRYFSPRHGINENDASLYIQTFMPFFWQERLGKSEMSFMQLSNRRGTAKVEIQDKDVTITAPATLTFRGELLTT